MAASLGLDLHSVVLLSVVFGSVAASNVTTEKEEITAFEFDVYHISSSTSSIDITWRSYIPTWVKVEKFEIQAKNSSSEVLFTKDLDSKADEYSINNLVPKTEYDVCIIASILNDTEELEITECMTISTIPYFREDSLYVLGGVIGVFLALVLIGCIAWRCAVYNAEKHPKKENHKCKIETSTKEGQGEEGSPFIKKDKPEYEVRRVFRPNTENNVAT